MKRIFAALALLLLLAGSLNAQHMGKLVQNTAKDVKVGPFTDSAGAALTGLTISQADVRLAKNDGAWAQKNQASSCSHEEAGWYECSLNTTDTNTLGILILSVQESGALPVWHVYQVTGAEDPEIAGDFASTADMAQAFLVATTGGFSVDTVGAALNTLSGTPTGTCDSGSTTTCVDAERVEGITDWARHNIIVFTGGTNDGQVRQIDAFTTGSDTITFSPALANAVTTETYRIEPSYEYLRPTTKDGRTLDITAAGEAGIDLDNAAGTLDAAQFGADFIDASKLAANVVTDLGLDTILADTNDLQTRTPAALVSGRMDASVGAMAANVVTAAATAADFSTEVQTGFLTVPKNTQYVGYTFRMFSSAGAATNGLTVSCHIVKDGGVAAACTNSVAEIAGGLITGDYKITFAAADLNVTQEAYVVFTAAGARDLDFKIVVQH